MSITRNAIKRAQAKVIPNAFDLKSPPCWPNLIINVNSISSKSTSLGTKECEKLCAQFQEIF